MISSQEFFDALRKVVKENKTEALEKYDSGFTGFMLGEKGILDLTLDEIKNKGCIPSNAESTREFYSLDYMIKSSENIDSIFSYGTYPAQIYAMIEHENRGDPEQEMFKLLLWRCPLKVLINYDWDEDQKSTDKRTNYVLEKRTLFTRLIKGFNDHTITEEGSNYLFIIGDRESSDAKTINWRAWKYDYKGNETELQ